MEAHRKALEYGGRDGAIDLGLVRSAVARPYNGHYPRIHQKAAALVQSVVKNHGFLDGNKRTAVLLVNTLLLKSGYRLRQQPKAETDDELEAMILAVARGSMTLVEIAGWFKDRVERN